MAIALATPEKRLFVSLITRDITLADAILDLVDNSINAAMVGVANPLDSAEAFYKLLKRTKSKVGTQIEVKVADDCVTVIDNAGGIDLKSAEDGIFHFGAREDAHAGKDRLSVFGIGMKRAMFKMGNRIEMESDHPKGGFSLDLNVERWQELAQEQWSFPIKERPKFRGDNPGTSVKISRLHHDVRKRISDPSFLVQLREKMAKTYAYFLDRLVKITLNNKEVKPIIFDIGENHNHQNYQFENVGYSITAGIALTSEHSTHTHESAGWFVFCNGRAVLYADKSGSTGWGGLLPVFQPKHRPFLGLVFFYSSSPESLPWNTTKDSINEESSVWQAAKLNMAALARPIVNLLDRRYNDSDTDKRDIVALAGSKTSSLDSTVAAPSKFSLPRAKKSSATRVQYDAMPAELDKIRKHLGRSSLSALGLNESLVRSSCCV